MKLRGTTALITGASSGIGAATARAMARKDARVILVARSQKGLESVLADITKEGGSAVVSAADVSRAEDVQEFARKLEVEIGSVDILVNNAGSGVWKEIEATNPEEVVQMTAVPYFAAFYITRVLLPRMLKRKSGHIVNVTSAAAYFGIPGATAYTVARWAMRGFHEQLQADLQGTGIRTTLIAPGKVATPYFENNPGSEERIPTIATIRWIYPTLTSEQVATAIVRSVERNKREVILPAAMRWTVYAHRIFPHTVQWLITRTGWKRS